ncbi:sugar-transfer associated ATP-grasp domain-containing protein [Roseivirga sp.]|uniref:sugar-transfer associated ATP-grasp domain-containing protein n=1 Tax=Roseivirga sp. TaxID=1964215 RepID=UPI003B8BF848
MKNLIAKFQKLESEVMGINERNIDFIYQYNKRADYKLADDKCLAKEIFHKHNIPCPKTFGVIHHLAEIDLIWQSVQNKENLVIKPAKGAGGKGIMILKQRKGQWYSGATAISEEQIYHHVANVLFGLYSFGDNDKAIVEEFVTPHHFFGEIYKEGVPDFRIILLESVPLIGMLRMPTKASDGKANLHQGGLGIGVELSEGVLTSAYNGKKYLSHHPDSNQPITGLEVPYWAKIMDMAKAVADVFPLKYLGVDLVIDQHKGPMIMEVNVRPGLGIQLANRKGLRRILETIKTKKYEA